MNSKKLYKVELTETDRQQLHEIVRKGEANTHVITRARILLKAATDYNDDRLAEFFDIHPRTALRTRQRFCEGGLQKALYDKPRSGKPKKYTGEIEAVVLATACSPAPEGASQWSLRLLADRMVELGVTEAMSPETVRGILKKKS